MSTRNLIDIILGRVNAEQDVAVRDRVLALNADLDETNATTDAALATLRHVADDLNRSLEHARYAIQHLDELDAEMRKGETE